MVVIDKFVETGQISGHQRLERGEKRETGGGYSINFGGGGNVSK